MSKKYFLLLLIFNITFSQNDTIYYLNSEWLDGEYKTIILSNYRKNKIYIDSYLKNVESCGYFSLKYKKCYILRYNKRKHTYLVQDYNGDLYTGLIVDFYGLGAFYERIRNGYSLSSRRFDSLNRLKEKIRYKYGSVEKGYSDRTIYYKPYVEFYSNGNIKIKGVKKVPYFIKKYREYHKNGNIKIKGSYDKKGNKKGIWRYYNEKGRLYEKIWIKNNINVKKDTVKKNELKPRLDIDYNKENLELNFTPIEPPDSLSIIE